MLLLNYYVFVKSCFPDSEQKWEPGGYSSEEKGATHDYAYYSIWISGLKNLFETRRFIGDHQIILRMKRTCYGPTFSSSGSYSLHSHPRIALRCRTHSGLASRPFATTSFLAESVGTSLTHPFPWATFNAPWIALLGCWSWPSLWYSCPIWTFGTDLKALNEDWISKRWPWGEISWDLIWSHLFLWSFSFCWWATSWAWKNPPAKALRLFPCLYFIP